MGTVIIKMNIWIDFKKRLFISKKKSNHKDLEQKSIRKHILKVRNKMSR